MGVWLSLMEYATQNGVSLSTLRRQIKSDKLRHRLEAGRYLVWSEDQGPARVPAAAHTDSVAELEIKLKKAREEIVELKTLLAFYEEQSPGSALSI
jgi:hypothetical protein